jgi:hypothetical protein
MGAKEKLINLIVESLTRADYSCEICNKMGYKCKVEIPENADLSFKPDFSKCDFKCSIYKTLTTEH